MTLTIDRPNEKQRLFLTDTHKFIAFGGARGGGKSWAVRTKAKLLALRYPGIRMLIVRRSYPELQENHIRYLRAETLGIAKYNDQRKELLFRNGSVILFRYCLNDGDADNFQGMEFDVIFLDEATQLQEEHIRRIQATLRGVNNFPKRMYYTCNPGGVSHAYIKRLFVDRKYTANEKPEDYCFIKSLVQDNAALMRADPDYIRQLEALPSKLRAAWLNGDWNIFEGQFFEDFCIDPDARLCKAAGIDLTRARREGRYCHVIKPFEIPRHWRVFRSFDWGYSKPFSCGWWAVDEEGTVYRILELYGCTGEPNEGVKWDKVKVFREIKEIETQHRWLKGKFIEGVADPAIWDGQYGESIAETADRCGVYFQKGDNARLGGWMQMHYRLAFDAEGRPGMYVFENCKAFIRTIPLLQYSQAKPEDLDTDGEDHVADETRYFLMSRPVAPVLKQVRQVPESDPLELYGR